MTKMIRIENADTSNHKVKVTVQDKDRDGNYTDVSTINIDHPTNMASATIYKGRRIVIEEVE